MGRARLTVDFACVAYCVCASLVCNYYCGRCPLDLLLVVILVSVDGHYCAKYYGKLFAGVLSSDNGPLSPVCLPEEGSCSDPDMSVLWAFTVPAHDS